MVHRARLLTAYLLSVAALAGLFAQPTAARTYDRAVRSVRVGQRLEFGLFLTRLDDHRHTSPDDLRQGAVVAAASADAGSGLGSPGTPQGVSAILATALVLHDDAFVRRLAPPGGPHTPRFAPLAPFAGRAPPSVS